MPMFKKQMVVVLSIALIAIVGTIYGTSSDEIVRLDESVESPTEIEREAQPSTSGKIFVYVTGAVNNPGMVELNGNELHLADAINASGGLLPTADADNINMADAISDGQHIRVPEKKVARSIEPSTSRSSSEAAEPSTSGRASEGVSSDGMVNINTAGIEELDTLPGIGPAIAQRIIDYRQLNGAFKSIDEIQNVRGIGAKKFENLKSRIKI